MRVNARSRMVLKRPGLAFIGGSCCKAKPALRKSRILFGLFCFAWHMSNRTRALTPFLGAFSIAIRKPRWSIVNVHKSRLLTADSVVERAAYIAMGVQQSPSYIRRPGFIDASSVLPAGLAPTSSRIGSTRLRFSVGAQQALREYLF